MEVVRPGQVVPVGLVSDVTRCPGPVRDVTGQHTRPELEGRAELASTHRLCWASRSSRRIRDSAALPLRCGWAMQEVAIHTPSLGSRCLVVQGSDRTPSCRAQRFASCIRTADVGTTYLLVIPSAKQVA
jgi:hypothetical protein